ncbi:MAG: hypothetical protein AB7U95_37540, partial [Reyranella sp.]
MSATTEAASTRRCPRCETVKHKSEFTSMNYCRPCSAAYSRERYAKRKQAGSDEGSEVIESGGGSSVSETKPPVRETKPPRAARPAAIRETPPVPVPVARQVRVTRDLAEALVKLLEDGERLTVSAIRMGSAIVVERL